MLCTTEIYLYLSALHRRRQGASLPSYRYHDCTWIASLEPKIRRSTLKLACGHFSRQTVLKLHYLRITLVALGLDVWLAF